VFVYNTSMTFDEILSYACDELGLTVKEDGRLRKIQALSEFLIDQLKKGGTGVLLIDEAQNLGDETLENLRLLSNLETKREKLLQIVLVGQPELESKLDQPQLRQIKQRVAVRYKLGHLQEREIGPFIDCRLRAVGFQRPSLFSPDALQEIALYSKGVPRLINNICDNALLIAYAKAAKKVSGEMIKEVARDLHLESGIERVDLEVLEETRVESPRIEVATPRIGAATPKIGAATPKVEAAVPKVIRSREEALRIIRGKPQEAAGEQFPNQRPETAGVKSIDATVRAWTEKVLQGLDDLGSSSSARFAVGVFLAVLLLAGVASATLNNKDRMRSFSLQAEKLLSLVGERFGMLKDNLGELFVAMTSGEDKPEKVEASLVAEPTAMPDKKPYVEVMRAPDETVAQNDRTEPVFRPITPEILPPETKLSTSFPTSSPPTNWTEYPVVVKQGSTIRQIAAHFYGPENLLLGMGLIKEFNPHINDLNWVSAGEGLRIPPLSRETLVRRQEDGSYRLIVGSFGSIMQAVDFAQAIRNKGFLIMIVPQRVSDNLLLHRVEIGGLENLEAVNRAWATAGADHWFDSSDKTFPGEKLNNQNLSSRKDR